MVTQFQACLLRMPAIGLSLSFAFAAHAGDKTAVFPFDLRDAGQEGEVVPQYNAEDLRRAKMVAEELKKLMAQSGRFEVVDLSSLTAEIHQAAPLVDCDGCEAPLAEKAGATLAITGLVNKFSDALISLQVYVRDVKTGQMKRTMSAAVQGNTDELLIHGVHWLWKNRFNVEAQAKESQAK